MSKYFFLLLTFVIFVPFSVRAYDTSLAKKLQGYILLQVQEHGEAWFVRHTDNKRYYMKDGGTAYTMMREFSLGITDADLSKIPIVTSTSSMLSSSSVCSSNSLAGKLKGQILLQVQQHGEAWYVYPKTCRRIYMQDGPAAYTIMRYLGLGITNSDLAKIETGIVTTKTAETSETTESDTTKNDTSAEESETTTETEFDPASHGSPHPKISSVPSTLCCNHPYYHKVYRALSNDETSWVKEGKLIKDRASVPAIIQLDDGSYVLYYVDGNYDTMDCSVSTDGETFTSGNCTIYGFTESKVWDPFVMKIDNGYYRMFFVSPPTDLINGQTKVMSALSKDGINWLQEDGVRFEEWPVVDPTVAKIGSTWYMYAGYSVSGGSAQIAIAKSTDGLTFKKDRIIDLGGNVPDVIEAVDGKMHLYFCKNGISRVSSSDGLNWSDERSVISSGYSQIICDPSVIQTSKGDWALYYKVQEIQSGGY
ncbi:hypothetical protein HY771_00930 [Candidatus Uhrbacteria bacterium]|nr:hypothetical protein [Candidatus Uhrbacteria bacterium]